MIQSELKLFRLQKPRYLCKLDERAVGHCNSLNLDQMVNQEKQKISEYLKQFGVCLRIADHDDLYHIYTMINERFSAFAIRQMSYYYLYQVIDFGYNLILEDDKKTIMGYTLNSNFTNEEKTNFGVIVTVDPALRNNHISSNMIRYVMLDAMSKGLRVRRATTRPENFASAAALLNHVGYIMEDFYVHFYPDGDQKTTALFKSYLYLDCEGILNNKIDMKKTLDFIHSHKIGADYKIIACDSYQELEQVYRETNFKIVAFLKQGLYSEKNCYLAIPLAELIKKD